MLSELPADLPTPEATELLGLVRRIADAELRPQAGAAEAAGHFPRKLMRTLGEAGLLGLPYPLADGGAGQPYEVYLLVVEELASAWLTVALGLSVHTLACYPLAAHGSPEQRARWLPEMLGGARLGAYCLSEPGAGSDAASLATRARRDGASFVLDGTKAWITHAGVADFYTIFVRTGEPGSGSRGVSVLLVDAGTPGLTPAPPEHKMGLRASPTGQLVLTGARVDADRLIGSAGQGFPIALEALDGGRLGIAACAVGLGRAALDYALGYARERRQFGRTLTEFQGVAFTLADAATGLEAARSLYRQAARDRDAGRTFRSRAAMAKLFATDTAMAVASDAVGVLGGAGYVSDHPVERYLREAKVLQIVEGTNQIQRLVISRALSRS